MTQLLWPDAPPGPALPTNIAPPTLTVYKPEGFANGAAMIVCPGGGYVVHADHEGEPIAKWLNSLGITAYVLHYRLAPHSCHPAMLSDAARAVRTVRSNAAAWNIDPARIGILGFSAGGHLASTLATHFDAGDPNATDPIERVSSRPNVAILIYAVISLQDPYAHAFSRQCLIGETPDPSLVKHLSNNLQVTKETPPTFLVHSAADTVVGCENSLLMALALSKAQVPFALHLYEKGEHGYGLGGDNKVLSTWPTLCGEWLEEREFLITGR